MPELHPDDVTVHDGIRITTPARTLVDLAECMDRDELRATFARAREIGLLDMQAVEASYARVEWRPSLRMLRGDGRAQPSLIRGRARQALDTMPAMRTTADVRIPMWPLTADSFERMVDTEILTEDDRVELLNGQLAEVSPQGPQHSGIAQWLASQLIREIDPEVAGVRVRMPLRFVPLSEPEPDIAIVPAGTYTHEHPTRAMLVIEVSKSSRRLDVGVKAEVYAAAAVAEYWVIDIAARSVHVHRSPAGGAYGSLRQVTSGRIRPDLLGAPAIDVETLFSLLD